MAQKANKLITTPKPHPTPYLTLCSHLLTPLSLEASWLALENQSLLPGTSLVDLLT